jgi:GNAT superfamily N-acetyltransferase
VSAIVYAREQDLPVDDYIKVVGNCSLGQGRPLNDRDRIAAMIRGADLIVTARIDGECVGLARCLTDFAWVAYLGDLGVMDAHHGKGIGKGLLAKLKEELGDGVGMALLSMPDAKPFYDNAGAAIGLHPNGDAYWMTRSRGA